MSDDFISDFRGGFDDDDDDPDWMQDTMDSGDEADDFDRLREQQARVGSMGGDLTVDEAQSGGSSFSLSNFTSSQRLILAILVVLNVIVIGVGVLAMLGII